MLKSIIFKYLFGKTADKLIDIYKGDELSNKIDQAFNEWISLIPDEIDLHPDTFYEVLFPHGESIPTTENESKIILKNEFYFKRVPSKSIWFNCLFDRWLFVQKNNNIDDLQGFFRLKTKDAQKYLLHLATLLHKACESISSLQIGTLYSHARGEREAFNKKNVIELLDASNDKKHWNLLLTSDFHIEDIYINPTFTVFSSEVGEAKPLDCSDEFIDVAETILNDQKTLYIIGKYGSGKTIASKKIQLLFSRKGWKCFYIKTSKIEKETIEIFAKSVEETGKYTNDILIIFDGLEDIFNPDISKKELFHELIEKTIELSNIGSQYHFLFNTRYLGINEKETFAKLSETYFDNGIYELKFIVLGEFDKPKQAEWLDSISNAQARLSGKEERFYTHELKHQGLIKACSNPLFLYKVSDFYYEDESKLLNKTYDIYKQFVDKTVKGRYQDENPFGSKSIQRIIENYKLFLKVAAKEIAKKRAILEQNVKSSEEHGLDPNFKLYDIQRSDLSVKAAELIEQEITYLHEIDQARLITNMMSCYFFEHIEATDSWKFRDNNIIYFLIAEDIFETIKKIFTIEQATKKIYEQLLLHLNVFFHPFIVDLLINRIKNEDENSLSWISAQIENMIQKNIILNLHDEKGVNLSVQKIRIDAILGIIYIQTNKNGYYNLPKILNNLIILGDLAYPIDISVYNAIRRSFRLSKLDGINFLRNNLDGYNMSGSSLRNSTIDQCYIDDFILTKSIIQNTTIKNCHIQSINLSNSSGNILFENCTISKIIATDCKIDTIKFIACSIHNMSIKFDKSYTNSFVIFIKTITSESSIKNAKKIKLLNSINSENCNFSEGKTAVDRVASYTWS